MVDNSKEVSWEEFNRYVSDEEIINAIPMYIGHINPKWEFWQQVKQQVNIK